MQQCGFCSMVSGLIRRALCVGSRRGSTESYYRELGDQDTLRIEDRTSDFSDDVEEIIQEIQPQARRQSDENVYANMDKKAASTGRFLTLNKRRRRPLVTKSLRNDAALLDDLQLRQVQCILDQSAQWKFNAFTLENITGGRCLPVLCIHLFQMYGLISHYKLDATKLWKLFSLIEEGYHSSNPYHNAVHAADVTQAMHCFLQQKQILQYLEPQEVMASLLAAIAHDLDHPGVNQPFLIATSNHLASLYQNTSVLENHHWRSAISCLIESGILEDLQDIKEKLEDQISSLILATDITRQQEYLSQFKGHLDTNTLDLRKREHRHLVLQIALKCADISNPCRPWEISKKWSLKVCEEFFRQGDYERKLNLPVTALCDRHNTSIPKIQTGFLKFVVTPLVSEWHRFLQNDLSTQMLDNLVYNKNKWESLVAKEAAEETRTEVSDADLVDDDNETCSGTNISDSSELLLPGRRSSLNPTKPSFREQLRRFSVPLNVFQDNRSRNRDRNHTSPSFELYQDASPLSSECSLHSRLSARDQSQSTSAEKVSSAGKLLPDSSIASITTPIQATRLNTVIKDGGSWKLTRQQTFPPLEITAREHLLSSRPMYTSNEDAIYSSRSVRSDFLQRLESMRDTKFNIFKKTDTGKTILDKASASYKVEHDSEQILEKESSELFHSAAEVWRDPTSVGSQLRDNLTSIALGSLDTEDLLMRRRKSMPTDTMAYTPKEKKVRDVAAAIPHILRRTLSGKECWTRRRGSAPAPVAPSELRGLVSPARHSINGGRRKPSPVVTCQQWLAKAATTVQEKSFPRRSSLPVEVLHSVEKMKTSQSN
ncbi:uncharacterized protein [Battus philenor]|uniref:uncharacterized protein isoform X2 n=1 Tax=Battus philenor TaxID=42288 RepID=UPI0035CF000C